MESPQPTQTGMVISLLQISSRDLGRRTMPIPRAGSVRRQKSRYDLDRHVSISGQTETSMLHIIWYIIVGFIIGLISRAIMPGAQHLGFIMTTLLGIAGSIVGGFIGRLFSKPEPGSAFHPAGFIMSIIGAIILLFIWIKLMA